MATAVAETAQTGVSPVALWPLISGARTTQLVYVAAKLGLARVLASGPLSSDDIAALVGAHPSTLERVMRAMATFGLLSEGDDGRFAVTPLGLYLDPAAPGSMHDWAIIWGELHAKSWSNLLESVRTGKSALQLLSGRELWEYLDGCPDLAAAFLREMSRETRAAVAAIMKAYDFSSYHLLVDVGGGEGALLAAILKSHPDLSGVLFDSERVRCGAERLLATEGIANRCKLVIGDFFGEIPGGGDGYLLKNILQDWDDERSRRILTNCRRAMRQGGRLLVIETLLPEPARNSPFLVQMDVQMLVGPGGRKRTSATLDQLIAAAGFRPVSLIPTESQFSIIEAVGV